MRIQNNKLLEVSESDLEDGVFYNDTITEIGSNCFYEIKGLKKIELPKVKKIGNWNFRSNASLTSVSLPLLAKCGSNNFCYNEALTSLIIGNNKLTVKNVDGYCFVIEGKRNLSDITIYSGYNFPSMNNGEIVEITRQYVAEKDGYKAHGLTIKKAIEDLNFKIAAEKLKNEPITPDTELTVYHYRLITGACDSGCRDFMQRHNIPYTVAGENETKEINPIKAKDLLPILEKSQAYGLDRFKQLLQAQELH